MRSKLFVPASRPELFDKALAGQADALSFDLEDSVPSSGKAAARERLAAFLRSDTVARSAKTVIVRTNALDGAYFDADIAALRGARLDYLNLPKVERAEDVGTAIRALDAAGLDAVLLVNIESPRGLLNAAAIAAADPRVAGLQAGLNDLATTLGSERRDPRNVHPALWTIRLAAAGAGCFAYDGAWPDLTDDAGFRAEAELARGLGFLGKSCIHPRQVPIANNVFAAGADALAEARRVVAAAATAAAAGRGAFVLDGHMVDAPMIARAKAVLAAGEGA